mmetsp:Transcript_4269/g.8167  ORF Transcript_4269/g.8167 Transcript_4269/m.8167 type:complete len:839 (+) Transcript_4269:123-2639(+)
MVSFDDIVLSIFPQVTTHLKHVKNDHASQLLPYDGIIAVAAVTYCRYTVRFPSESKPSRIFWSIVLGYLAYNRYDYWLQFYVHLLSFGEHFYLQASQYFSGKKTKENTSIEQVGIQAQVLTVLWTCALIIGHLFYSMSYPNGTYSLFQSRFCKMITEYPLLYTLLKAIYSKVLDWIDYLIPVREFISAHDIITEFVNPTELYAKAGHLLFVTFHIQVGMGFLGIEFLRAEQSRKNALVKIEEDVKGNQQGLDKTITNAYKNNGSTKQNGDCKLPTKEQKEPYDASKKFRKGAGPFIFFVALPYMVQIVFYGGLNMYAFHCFRDDIHRTIRLNDLFANDGGRFVATATSKASNLTPDAYATNSETVVTTVYDTFNRNLFSLPKLMLLPGIIAKQPMLLIKITPMILLSDWIKSTIVATITTEVERVNKEVKDLESMRTKVEQYDLKNSELIQRSGYGSIMFTERKWVSLTEEIQDKKARTSLMTRSKTYFAGLQRHFIMMALVDCALAKLIAVGKIFAADIFVYARAIEDMINFVLMRSRAESELASMESSIKVLRELKDIWNASEQRNLLDCSVNSDSSSSGVLVIDDLRYTRGSASVEIKDLKVTPGIYALTGANGSGKSTLFRLLMGCKSNRESVDLHSSIVVNSSGNIQMPSSDVIEITQNFYFPLFSTPFDWIYNIDIFEGVPNQDKKNTMVKKLEEELKSLNFYPETQLRLPDSKLMEDLTSEKDDWFSDLSGGQKSKVELVRKVFLAEQCPKVLLIDETFAPLDPDSKNLVMQKIKNFCRDSIVIVIYHADVKVTEGEEQDKDVACVESSNFFDSNIHVENGALKLRPVCVE